MNGRGLGVRSHSRLSIGTKEPMKTTLGFMARKIQQVGAKGQQDCQSGMEEAWVPNAVGFGARPSQQWMIWQARDPTQVGFRVQSKAAIATELLENCNPLCKPIQVGQSV